MQFGGKITGVSGRKLIIELDDDFDLALARRISDGEMKVAGDVLDKRSITRPQQSLINALFADASEYTSHPFQYWEHYFKGSFAIKEDVEEISIKTNNMTQVEAGRFIEFILEFMFANEIPFKFQEFHLAGDISRILFIYLKYRACFICGKPNSDYAHFEALGMGRDRKTVDHSQHRFMCLCRDHHQEQHRIGIKSFMSKYQLAPIKLKPEQIKEFGIGGKSVE